MCGLGYTIATIETYKTFFFPNKPRGKFAGKPILFPKMLKKRRLVAVLYGLLFFAFPWVSQFVNPQEVTVTLPAAPAVAPVS